MPRTDRTGWPLRGTAVGLFLGVAGLWTLALAPQPPASSPIHLVADFMPVPATPEALEPTGAGAPVVARLLFAGDIMQHRAQGGDDFHRSYARVAPLIGRADLAIGNLEFPVDTTAPVGPPPGSTRFNGSPAHLDALRDAGFDLLGTANNHVWDQGSSGVVGTVAQLERRGLVPLGTARTREELDRTPIVAQVPGAKVAFRAYTMLPNVQSDSAGNPLWPPADLPVFVLDFAQWRDEYRAQGLALFREHVAQARAAGADLVVAFVHWGKEWYLRPTEDQRSAAHDLIDAGFDLVVGAHSHVINGPEVYRGRLIAYSLGNLVSDFRTLETRTGALLAVDLARRPDGKGVAVSGFRYLPVVVHPEQGHQVVPAVPGSAGVDHQAWSFARSILGPATVDSPDALLPQAVAAGPQ